MNRLIFGILFLTISFFLPLSNSYTQEVELDFPKLNTIFQNVVQEILAQDQEGPFQTLDPMIVAESTDFANDIATFAIDTAILHPNWNNNSPSTLNSQIAIELVTRDEGDQHLNFDLGATARADSLNVAKDLFTRFLLNKWEEEAQYYSEDEYEYLIDFPSSEVAFKILPDAKIALNSGSLEELFDHTQRIVKKIILLSKDVVVKLEEMQMDEEYEFEWDILQENIDNLNNSIAAFEQFKMEKKITEDGQIEIKIDATSSLNLLLGGLMGGDNSIANVAFCGLAIDSTSATLEANVQLNQFLHYYFKFKQKLQSTLIAAQNGNQEMIEEVKGMFNKIYGLLRGFITGQ